MRKKNDFYVYAFLIIFMVALYIIIWARVTAEQQKMELDKLYVEDTISISKKDLAISRKVKYWEEIKTISKKYSIPPELMATVQIRETGHLPFSRRDDARSPAGAIGLMQIMPFHAKNYGHYPVELRGHKVNLKISASLLSRLYKKYEGNIEMVLAAYNAGEYGAERGREFWPRETVNYVSLGTNSYNWLVGKY